jgi:hypothetical protein
VFNAPWYVSNKTLHKDCRIPLVEDEIIRMTNRYLLNLTGHSNEQVNQLHAPPPPPPPPNQKTTQRKPHRDQTKKKKKEKSIIFWEW